MKFINIILRHASNVQFEFEQPNEAYAMMKALKERKADFTGFFTLPHPAGEIYLCAADIAGFSIMDYERLAEEGCRNSIVKQRIVRDHDRRHQDDLEQEMRLLHGKVGVGS